MTATILGLALAIAMASPTPGAMHGAMKADHGAMTAHGAMKTSSGHSAMHHDAMKGAAMKTHTPRPAATP